MRVHQRSQLAGILLTLGACGKAEDRPVAVGPTRDSGSDVDMDARVDGEAQLGDAGPDAASGDGSVPDDAAVGGDGSTEPGDEDAGWQDPFNPEEGCMVLAERSELAVPVTFGDETGFTLTPGLTGFGVAYQSNRCGAISVLPVASTGEYKKPSELYAGCDTVAQGVSLLHVSNGYRLTWVDNFSGSAELQSLQLAEALKPPADSTRTARRCASAALTS
jgi:hypothetical protein